MTDSMYSDEERERRKALIACNNECARCGGVAWRLSLEAEMQLRPKRNDPRLKELVCGECCRKQDAATTRQARRERRAVKRQRGRAA